MREKGLGDGGHRCPSCASEEQQCPRCQAYERLPKWKWLQALITFVMGIPHDGQVPLLKQTKASRLATIFVAFFGAVGAAGVITALLFVATWLAQVILAALLVVALLAASGMFRSMSMYVLHYASHGSYDGPGDPAGGRWSRLIGHAASSIAFTLSLEEYAEKHNRKHHGKLGEKEDPDQQTIIALGFVPGMPYEFYRAQLLRVLVSPRHFWLHLRGRWASQFASARSSRLKALAVAVQVLPLAAAFVAVYVYGSGAPLLVWAVAWLLPLTYGTYVSMVLFALGLHRWFLQREPWMGKWEFYLAKTRARFFGDPVPPAELPTAEQYRRWGWWWVRFFLLHLLTGKLFVMGLSDNQQHDAHHIDPRSREFLWWDSTYSRQRLASSGRDDAQMSQTWGSLLAAVRDNFERMARTPRLGPDELLAPPERDNDLLNGM